MAEPGGDGSDDDPTLTGDKRILHRARQRFLRCQNWYGPTYGWSLLDTKFANADDRNHDQWPEKVWELRDNLRKPCLTINKTQTHNRLVINESMRNKASIRIRPTGGRATVEASEGMQSLVDRVEYISSATVAYRQTITHQVEGGIGYLFLETAYVSDKSFDQDIYIKSATDPRNVYLDPDTKEADGSDAGFGHVFDKMPRDKFNRLHRKYKDKVGKSTLGHDGTWMDDKHILVCLYYERDGKNDELITFTQEDGSTFSGHRSDMEKDSSPELVDAVIEQIDSGQIDGKYRDVINQKVKWYLIAGDYIMKRGDWAGQYIPIIPLYGIKTIIEGKLDLKGHTRALISPQLMLNYNASGQVQFGALQSKTPYIGPMAAFEANEDVWKVANIEEKAYLPYNDWVKEEGEEGRPVTAPQRTEPPQTSPVYMQGMQDAERQMMMVSGQYQAQMGEDDRQSAASGKAINERQRQGDTATYHFTEHQYDMYRYLGKQLIDLIPKIYDTARILHVEGEDGTKQQIEIDPDAQEAIQRIKKETDTAERIIMNPAVGEYEVLSDPGPNYATQRQQAWDAMTTIVQQNAEMAGIIGDILFKNGDFAGAQELADRMKKFIKANKPYLFDETQDPGMVGLQQQLQQASKLNGELIEKLAILQLQLKGKDEKRDIDASNAETSRLDVLVKALENLVLTPKDREMMEHEITSRTHDAALDMVVAANAAEVSPDEEDDRAAAKFHPSMIGARKAKDGNHYITDPSRPGKYLRVDAAA